MTYPDDGTDPGAVEGSQLDRSLEDRQDKRRMLADLRESGALETGRRESVGIGPLLVAVR